MPGSDGAARAQKAGRQASRLASRPASLRDCLAEGRFAITAEVAPPLSADPQGVRDLAAPLLGLVNAVNVTDGAGARTAMSSLAAAAILQEAGFETVLQVTCRDRNRIALAADLLGASALGVRNLLVLHGDDPARGDTPEAKPVYDLDSREVIRLAHGMRDDGMLPSGRAIKTPPQFLIGAADTPHDPAPNWRPHRLMAKQEAGAEFVQTQFCFDPGVVRRYLARLADVGLTETLGVLIGIGPLASAASARWMNDKLFGVEVPDALIARLDQASDQAAEGRRICVELIEELREIEGVAGVHLMAPRQGAAAIAAVIGAIAGA